MEQHVERIAKLEERTFIMLEDQRRTDDRLCGIERDIATMKADMSAISVTTQNIAATSEETRKDIKNARTWIIVTMITFLLGIGASAFALLK